MKELSLHILDIVQNSIKAGAENIRILIEESAKNNRMSITIADDGCGMSEEFLARVKDPFTTTRTTRKAGMGISLFQSAAEQTGGFLDITSKLGEGTTLCATFVLDSIDRAPLGDMAETMVTIIRGAPDIDYYYEYKTDDGVIDLDTKQIRSILGGVALDTYDVLMWIKDAIS